VLELNIKTFIFDVSVKLWLLGCDGTLAPFPDNNWEYDRHPASSGATACDLIRFNSVFRRYSGYLDGKTAQNEPQPKSSI
jgi:hypothetical protein